MIIECGSCNSRFRLDESRITGRGARVRCRKCGEPITVMKADAAGREEPSLAPDGFDLRSIVREAMEAPESREPQADEPAGPAGPEPDLEKMLADSGKEPDAAPPDAGGRAPDEPAVPEPPPAAGPTVDFRTDEELTFASSGRKETPAPEDRARRVPEGPEGPQAPAAKGASPEFMMSTADSLDFLKSDYDQGAQETALDISGNLRVAPASGADEGRFAAPPGAPASHVPPPPPPAEPPSRSAEIRSEPAGPERGDAGADPAAGRGWPGAAAAEAAAAVTAASAPPRGTVAAPPSFPPPRETATPARPPASRKRPAGKGPALKRRQSSQLVRPSVVLLLLLFLALAGGGAYLGFTSDGQRVLRGLVPQVESLWPAGEKSVSSYTIGNLVGYYENNGAAGRMFVIRGQVTNDGRLRRTGVRIHAALLDARSAKIAEKTVYAGNVLAGDAIRKAARAKIEEAMSNPIGGGLANMDIAPGKSIPFMVVFFDAPDGIDSYRLEPRDAE
ncbi:MAG: DUF3426 domain-containing protein [Deltaproteobacteria bacterium]